MHFIVVESFQFSRSFVIYSRNAKFYDNSEIAMIDLENKRIVIFAHTKPEAEVLKSITLRFYGL